MNAMNVTVLIHRQQPGEIDAGSLRAWIVQDGNRGRNLLQGRWVTHVYTAKNEIRRKLMLMLAGGDITFVGPEEAPRPVAVHRREATLW